MLSSVRCGEKEAEHLVGFLSLYSGPTPSGQGFPGWGFWGALLGTGRKGYGSCAHPSLARLEFETITLV